MPIRWTRMAGSVAVNRWIDKTGGHRLRIDWAALWRVFDTQMRFVLFIYTIYFCQWRSLDWSMRPTLQQAWMHSVRPCPYRNEHTFFCTNIRKLMMHLNPSHREAWGWYQTIINNNRQNIMFHEGHHLYSGASMLVVCMIFALSRIRRMRLASSVHRMRGLSILTSRSRFGNHKCLFTTQQSRRRASSRKCGGWCWWKRWEHNLITCW